MTQSTSIKARAVALLSRREYSRQELRQKLVGDDEASSAGVDPVLDQLEQDGLLSEQRFAEQIARRHRGRHGARTVEQELVRRGVRAEIAEPVVAAARENEIEEARAALEKKFAKGPDNMEEWARQGRYLQNRGYSLETIRRILRVSFGREFG